MGTSLQISSGVTVQEFSEQYLHKVIHGEELAEPAKLLFKDLNAFRAGELHKHYRRWCKIVGDNPSPNKLQYLGGFELESPFLTSFNHSLAALKAVITNRIVPHRRILEIALPVNLLLTL